MAYRRTFRSRYLYLNNILRYYFTCDRFVVIIIADDDKNSFFSICRVHHFLCFFSSSSSLKKNLRVPSPKMSWNSVEIRWHGHAVHHFFFSLENDLDHIRFCDFYFRVVFSYPEMTFRWWLLWRCIGCFIDIERNWLVSSPLRAFGYLYMLGVPVTR